MAPIFKSISSFRNAVESLLKVKRKVYSSIIKDIENEFENKDIKEIFQLPNNLISFNDSKIIKFRCKDSNNNRTKKDGYSIIYFVSQSLNLVVFMTVYPKRGPSQKIDLNPLELQNLVIELNQEMKSKSLTTLVFADSSTFLSNKTSTMEDKILKIMNEVFETSGLDTSCSQSNYPSWDSLHHLNLIMALEEEFDVEFEPEEIAQMKDFDTVKKMIESKL